MDNVIELKCKHEFGNGKVKMSAALVDGKGILALQNITRARPIGSQEDNKGMDALLFSDTLLSFDNIDSAKALVYKIQQVIALMEGKYKNYEGKNTLEVYTPNKFLGV